MTTGNSALKIGAVNVTRQKTEKRKVLHFSDKNNERDVTEFMYKGIGAVARWRGEVAYPFACRRTARLFRARSSQGSPCSVSLGPTRIVNTRIITNALTGVRFDIEGTGAGRTSTRCPTNAIYLQHRVPHDT